MGARAGDPNPRCVLKASRPRTNVRREMARNFWFAVPIIVEIDPYPFTSNRGSLGPLAPG
jgi:hypothetical protein